MKFFYLLIIILLILISCKKNDSLAEYNTKAIKLNSEAVQLVAEEQYDSAFSLLNKAIEFDSTYYLAYSNKVTIYLLRNDYKNAFKQIKKILEIKKDFAEGWLLAGLIIEMIENKESAIKYYQKAINIYTKQIDNPGKPEQVPSDKLNRAVAKILLGKGEEGRAELIEVKNAYSDYRTMATMYLEKSREEIILTY